MDGISFDNIKQIVSSQHFEGKKLDALRSSLGCSSGYLSAEQVVQLLQQFPFDDGRTKCVEMCAPRLYGITCDQAASILRIFSFDKSKPRALELIACHITDNNLEALDSAFDFQREKKRAREILMNRARAVGQGPHAGFPPQPGNYLVQEETPIQHQDRMKPLQEHILFQPLKEGHSILLVMFHPQMVRHILNQELCFHPLRAFLDQDFHFKQVSQK